MNWTRRDWLGAAGGLVLAGASSSRASDIPPLKFATTPVFLDRQATLLQRWQRYLETHLARPVAFVQRANYREITDLLLAGEVDCAWICGFPYVRHRPALRLVSVPLYQGAPLYQAYIIAPTDNSATHRLKDLRGTVFAYADPDSNSGWLAPQVLLKKQDNTQANDFFRRTFFTWSHRKVVQAVAVGLAQGGAVDGYVWDTLARGHPELTEKTRIIERSGPFGFPPIVARHDMPAPEIQALQRALQAMHLDVEGQVVLAALNLDGFASAKPDLYDGIEANWRALVS
ncbi:MAG: PhnD/SsuA/transferrin family substrate-binding protein [Thiobacillus sp.]|nr:PhnD/SsuA/transferrin family substrate-binding protein [Thiobacillus sp.]